MSKCLVLILLVFFSFQVHSAVILKIKGRKALVDLEGVKAEKGDRFDALNLYGKPLGLLEIKKVKRNKAIAVLLKGKMSVSWILEPTSQSASSSFNTGEEYDPVGSKNDDVDSNRETYIRSSKSSSIFSKSTETSSGIGVILGAHFNTISLSNNKMVSGLGWKAALFADYTITGPLGIRLIAGHQTLLATGSKCGMGNCNLLINYPGAGFLLRGVFLKHLIFQPWLGGGGFLLWPIADQKADLGLDRKSFNSFHGVLTASAGIDLHFNGFYLPIQVDANWINPVLISLRPLKEGSKEFKPFYLGAKIGIAFSF